MRKAGDRVIFNKSVEKVVCAKCAARKGLCFNLGRVGAGKNRAGGKCGKCGGIFYKSVKKVVCAKCWARRGRQRNLGRVGAGKNRVGWKCGKCGMLQCTI